MIWVKCTTKRDICITCCHSNWFPRTRSFPHLLMVQNWLAPAGAGSFRYLFIYRALYIPGGAEFVPSTVSVYTIGHFQHQKMQLFPCSFLMGDPSITKELIPQLDLLKSFSQATMLIGCVWCYSFIFLSV